MPWSEWITPDPLEMPARGYSLHLTRTGHFEDASDLEINDAVGVAVSAARHSTETVADTASVGSADAVISGTKGSTSNPFTSADATIGQQIYTVVPIGDPLTFREWFPDLLRSLAEGVDYDVIPGKDPLQDDDAYVQYEGGPNALLGWQTPWAATLVVDAGTSTTGMLAPEPQRFFPDTFPLRFGIGAATYDPTTEEPAPDAEWTDHPYGWGADTLDMTNPPVTVGDDLLTTTELPIELPIDLPADTVTFGLAIQNSLQNDLATPPTVENFPQATNPAGESSTSLTQLPRLATFVEGSNVVALGPPFMTQMPRWRYWIPGTPPLRQRQRDDGLGLSGTPRWRRGSSRQASNRWRGYL